MKGQRCTLQEALGGVERCAGDDCSFWETGREEGCVIAPIRLQLLERPALARHLLDLRLALDRAVPGQEQDESRRLFYRLLNEEQAAE